MKYYLTENYRTKKTARTSRITGDSTDKSWIKKQMDYRFQQELTKQRDNIANAGVICTENENKLLLKDGSVYSLKIKEINPIVKTRYYIEFVHNNSDEENYDMQSKWFNTPKEARKWLRENFDFICGDMNVYLLTANFTEEGDYDIVAKQRLR